MRKLAVLALAAAICACDIHRSSPSEPDGHYLDRTVTLAVGAQVHLGRDLSLSLERIVSDSRCPVGVTCVWEGEVTVALVLRSDHDASSFQLSDHLPPVTVLGYTVSLLSVVPLPTPTGPPPTEAYRVTVRVRTGHRPPP